MSAAFHRDLPHHLCLDYHRRTNHRFTEPHRSSSTPHLLHRDRLPSQINTGTKEEASLKHRPSIRASIDLRQELNQQARANFT
ncbi:hypothetical protein Bca52824_046262 [Brassica carinata]|uniref:Uncharacterized protein n=1 Tax=Brassica carinata TaxID=52824 RepID=A0A8X7RCD0_BRACI|nr:hypothetical protein Bca52824_046262 [Brassica carinata]